MVHSILSLLLFCTNIFKRAEKINDETESLRINEEIEDILLRISQECAETTKNAINKLSSLFSDPTESFNQAKMWEVKKKLVPKNGGQPPTAKRDKQGNLVTDKTLIKKLLVDNYKERLSPNIIEEELEEIEELKETLYSLRYDEAKKKKTCDWEMGDLEKVLRSLKNGKSRDLHGHIYEIFKYGGKSLKMSLLRMANMIKNIQKYPKILQPASITSIYKGKGDK